MTGCVLPALVPIPTLPGWGWHRRGCSERVRGSLRPLPAGGAVPAPACLSLRDTYPSGIVFFFTMLKAGAARAGGNGESGHCSKGERTARLTPCPARAPFSRARGWPHARAAQRSAAWDGPSPLSLRCTGTRGEKQPRPRPPASRRGRGRSAEIFPRPGAGPGLRRRREQPPPGEGRPRPGARAGATPRARPRQPERPEAGPAGTGRGDGRGSGPGGGGPYPERLLRAKESGCKADADAEPSRTAPPIRLLLPSARRRRDPGAPSAHAQALAARDARLRVGPSWPVSAEVAERLLCWGWGLLVSLPCPVGARGWRLGVGEECS